MQTTAQDAWNRAHALEESGDFDAAEQAYMDILRDDVDQAYAWVRLSVIAQMRNSYRNARMTALRAAHATLKRGRWRALPYVAQRLLMFDERTALQGLVEGADWSNPLVLQQSAVLAQSLWLAGGFESALALLDRAVAVAPDSHLLAYARGDALKYLGRSDEATAEYERSIALSPNYPNAHWALAYHASAREIGSRVGRVRAALARAPADSLEAMYLGYALFKELDDAGDAEGAWDALQKAARTARTHVTHDIDAERASLAALREMPVDAPPVRAHAGRVPVFIVGMPRTGTTVLDRILGNHSRIRSAGELNLFSCALGETADRFFEVPAARAQLDAAQAAAPAVVGQIYRERTALLYEGATHLVDKNPANVFNAGFIARALPEAKIVCLVRDPMDACFSNLKELFAGDSYGYSYDLGELAAHYLAFRDVVEHWRASLPGRFMTVRYEDLVADPDRTVAEVMSFLGLDYEAGTDDITRNTKPVSTASSSQVRQPIHARGIGAWKRYASQLAPLRERLVQGGVDVDE